jgi:sodium/pantothenate symporter
MNLGFTISPSTQNGILVVFLLYSVAIVLLGLYVKYASKNESANQKLSSYLTGGGGLGPVALGMLIFTNLMASGGMVGGPGLGYNVGFIWAIAVYCSFICTFISLCSTGKKIAIMKQRINAQTVIQIFRHRYDSKVFAVMIGLIFIIFLLPYAASQFVAGAKLFAVVTGSSDYTAGIFLFTLVTLIYTLTGGIKSLARVAVLQGFIMLISVILLYIGTRDTLIEKYGTLEAAMEFITTSKPGLLNAWTWSPLAFIGNCILMSFAIPALPSGLMTNLTYKKSSVMVRGAVVGIICYTTVQITMSGVGPLGYAVNQTLTSGDYVNPMLVSTVLSPWLGGLVIAGSAAAMQSTAAAFMIIIASTIMKDFYKDIVNPDATAEQLNRGNLIFTTLASVIAIVIALFPNNYVQLVVNFAIGGIAAGFLFPLYFGLYWKKATSIAAIASCLGGFVGYIATTLFASNPTYRAITFGAPSVIVGLVLSLILMLGLSPITPKVKKGVFQVWFGKTYDEKYAKLDH